VIDPLSMLDQYGTDAFRFTLAMLAAQGRDVLLSEERIEGGRNFVNKLWNASRLTTALLEGKELAIDKVTSSFLPDRWIRSRVRKVAGEVEESINAYRYSEAALTLHSFVWHEFCDWYLELVKPNLYGKVTQFEIQATASTLHTTFLDILRLLHPFMPFITEEIYQQMPLKGKESIMIEPFPQREFSEIDEQAETGMNMLMGVVNVIRNIRGEMGFAPNVKIEAHIRAHRHTRILEEYAYYIKELAKVEELLFVTEETAGRAAIGMYEDVEVFIPIKDPQIIVREINRIDKELGKIGPDIERTLKKINNEAFRGKAPPEVIKKEEVLYEDLCQKREKLVSNRATLEGLLKP
jgi:valyl-tRNA synthetase